MYEVQHFSNLNQNHFMFTGFDIKDYGDVATSISSSSFENDQKVMSGARNFSTVAGFNATLSSSVADIVRSGRVCITLGGDHSVAIGYAKYFCKLSNNTGTCPFQPRKYVKYLH